MRLQPRLIDVAVPARPEGVVLALHGGASRRENMMVSTVGHHAMLRHHAVFGRLAADFATETLLGSAG